MVTAESASIADTRPLVVGLTGGTGVGKSTVARLLAEHGAIIVDCDELGRQVVGPGGAALAGLAERFGPGVLTDDGTLDRARLANIVFNDAEALAQLNRITHPAIDDLIAEHIAAASSGDVVVLDMAVLVESELGAGQYDLVVVIETALDTRIERLSGRGMTPEDARSRIASQATDEERRAVADVIVTNDGDETDLAVTVSDLWTQLSARRRQQPG